MVELSRQQRPGEDGSLVEHAEYTALAFDASRRRASYRSFCTGDDNPAFVSALREATDTGLPLVGNALHARLVADGRRVEREKPGPRAERRRQSGGASAERQLRLQE